MEKYHSAASLHHSLFLVRYWIFIWVISIEKKHTLSTAEWAGIRGSK